MSNTGYGPLHMLLKMMGQPYPTDILSLGNDGKLMDPTDSAMSLIGQTGLAAGKIYFKTEHTTISAVSGFFVERRFFLTCAHEPTDRAKQAGYVEAKISSCRLSEFGKEV